MEVMACDTADEVIKEHFQSLLSRYQIGLETSTRGSDCIFDSVYLLHYKCHKINFKRGESYINFVDRIKSKKAAMNPINKNDNNCFQYATTVTLNYEKIGKNPERITKIKLFISEYN